MCLGVSISKMDSLDIWIFKMSSTYEIIVRVFTKLNKFNHYY